MSIDTVNDIAPRIQYVAAAAQTAFDYPFPIFEDGDLVVIVDGVTKALSTHYTVTGEGDDTGGTVTFLTAMTGDEIVTIYRDIPIERTSDIPQNGPYLSATINNELDRMTMVDQQLKAALGRALRLPQDGEANSTQMELSPIANWKGKYVYINADGIPEPVAGVSTVALTQDAIGQALHPQTQEEEDAGVTPQRWGFSTEYIQVQRYLAPGVAVDGNQANAAAHKAAIDAALAVATEYGGAPVVFGRGNFVLDTPIVPDCNHLELIANGAILTQGSGSPTNGAVICTLAGDSDSATLNQAILDGIYGAGVVSVRTNVTGSLEGFVMRGFRIVSASGTKRGLHASGLARQCAVVDTLFSNFAGYAIAINGSWTIDFDRVQCQGPGSTGTGIGLGINGLGYRSNGSTATQVVNDIQARAVWCGNHSNGFVWNSGAGGDLYITCEGNSADGFQSQSAAHFSLEGYFEGNGSDNLSLGGTNGADFIEDAFIRVKVSNSSGGGNNIRLNGMKRCFIAPVGRSGSRTQTYIMGSGANFLNNVLFVPAIDSTNITTPIDLDQDKNIIIRTDDPMHMQLTNATVRSSFRHLGGTLGVFGASVGSKPTITGSRGSNAALADLLTKLATLGHLTDSTS